MTQTKAQKIASKIYQLMLSNQFQKAKIRQVTPKRILVDRRIGERGKATVRIDLEFNDRHILATDLKKSNHEFWEKWEVEDLPEIFKKVVELT